MGGTNSQNRVYYDDNCEFCRLWKDVAAAGDSTSAFLFLPMNSQDSQGIKESEQLIMVGEDGKTISGMNAVGRIAKRIPVLLPILPVTSLLRLMHLDTIAYSFIAHRRYSISRILKLLNRQSSKGTGS